MGRTRPRLESSSWWKQWGCRNSTKHEEKWSPLWKHELLFYMHTSQVANNAPSHVVSQQNSKTSVAMICSYAPPYCLPPPPIGDRLLCGTWQCQKLPGSAAKQYLQSSSLDHSAGPAAYPDTEKILKSSAVIRGTVWFGRSGFCPFRKIILYNQQVLIVCSGQGNF